MLATAKIHILKQFTTQAQNGHELEWLCLLLQRYTFWSNSQLLLICGLSGSYCACYCKDTHFEAIHNRFLGWFFQLQLCLLLQRYTFWSNSQLQESPLMFFLYCACYCKDTHFEAIHNITIICCLLWLLCLLLQRYTFWSNSQQLVMLRLSVLHCACYCKDTHFEAIHNDNADGKSQVHIVLATAKIHILKQFTTRQIRQLDIITLCLLLQRYTFWSNSQPFCMTCILKKIVLATAKIHILKQFTTKFLGVRLNSLLCLLLQRYTFWSNSQRSAPPNGSRWYCACYCKDTHFEAIHNLWNKGATLEAIVLATAKIHILKQFTTELERYIHMCGLCLLLQRYTFWSNSQPVRQLSTSAAYCACYCKDTHFEAIHNAESGRKRRSTIVLATAKIHILKQFTTYLSEVGSSLVLCLLLQRYTFWSNSQPPNGRLCKLKLVFWLLVSLACILTDFFLAFSWMRSWLLRRAYRLAAKGWSFAESINHLRFLHLCLLDAVR